MNNLFLTTLAAAMGLVQVAFSMQTGQTGFANGFSNLDYGYEVYEVPQYMDYGYEVYDVPQDYSIYYYYDYISEGELKNFITSLPCKVQQGVELQGGDLLTDTNGEPIYFKTNSFRDCAIVCGMHPTCGKYTYVNYGGENSGCYLKKASGYTEAGNEFAVSGDGCLAAAYQE